MDSRKAIKLLQQALDDLGELPPNASDPGFKTWRETTKRTLARIFGEKDDLTRGFDSNSWSPWIYPASADGYRSSFESGRSEAEALLNAALHDQQVLGSEPDKSQDFESTLWNHVSNLYEQGRWEQVASQTVIFAEDRVRAWSGAPETLIGEDLWTHVLKPDGGLFPMGRTPGEKQGWHRLGMGLSLAARNVDTHRIQKRSDLRQYAVGVLGTASLLLTQLRWEHGNRFVTDN